MNDEHSWGGEEVDCSSSTLKGVVLDSFKHYSMNCFNSEGSIGPKITVLMELIKHTHDTVMFLEGSGTRSDNVQLSGTVGSFECWFTLMQVVID